MSKAHWSRHADAVERPIPAEVEQEASPARDLACEVMAEHGLNAETQATILALAQEYGEALALSETWSDLASDAKHTRNLRTIAFVQQTWAAARATTVEALSRLDFAVADAMSDHEGQQRQDVYTLAKSFGRSIGVNMHHHDDFVDPYIAIEIGLREGVFGVFS